MSVLLRETVISLADNLINTFNNYTALYKKPEADKVKIQKIIKSRAGASYDLINNYTILYPELEILTILKRKVEDALLIMEN